MHPEEIVHYIRIVKNEKSVLYLTYKIICGRQRLYALRLEKNRAKNNCAACRKSSGRRRNLSSGAFHSEFPFGSGLGQTEKSQNSPSEKVRNMQKNPVEIERFQPDLVGVSGFEPEASWSRTKRDTKLRHTPKA